jgi:O-antigen/teichoic acid export membrane protein
MNRKLFSNSAYYMLAALLPTMASFLMLPIYTRYLTPTDYGVVALVLSFQVFLLPLFTLKINDSILRFYFDYKDNKKQLKLYISTIILFVIVLSSLMLFILIYNLDDLILFILPKTLGYNNIFLLGIISSFFNVYLLIAIHLIRVQQKAKLFMKVSLSMFLVSLIINVLEVIVYERGAYGVIEASLITVIVSCFVYLYLVKEFFIFRFDFTLIWNPLKYSFPLIPHSLAGLIFMYSDRIILEKYVTLSAIGLYMLSDKIAMVFKILVNEFNNAFSPYFNEKSKESKKLAIQETQNISILFIYSISMLIVLVSLFSVEIVYWLFDERYFDIWMMIPLLSSSYIFRSLYCFSSSGLFYEKKTGKVAMITIIAGFVNIGLNLLLIPTYGIMVAIYTTILSFFITFIMAELISYKIYYLQLNIKQNILIVGYMFAAISFSLYLNKSFFEFSYIEYVFKIIVLMIGLSMGYRLNLFKFDKLLKIKG